MDDDFGLWEVVVSIFWFMLLVAWIWLLVSILTDIFRDRQMSGGTKALWTLLIILLPWLGSLIYLVVRGSTMAERQAERAAYYARAADAATAPSGTAAAGGIADELRKLAELRDSGMITPEEHDRAKAKILA